MHHIALLEGSRGKLLSRGSRCHKKQKASQTTRSFLLLQRPIENRTKVDETKAQ